MKTQVKELTEWKGVVMVERPNNFTDTTPCPVHSARTIMLDGHRAISCFLPYGMLKHYFTIVDSWDICLYAEFKDNHLELYERASKQEYFLHASDHLASPTIN